MTMEVKAENLPIKSLPDVVLSPADELWVVAPPRGIWMVKVKRIVKAFRDPAVAIPAVILLGIMLACFLGPLFGGVPNPDYGNFHDILLPIGAKGFVLGTNNLGNDMFSRLLYGGRVSLVVGVGATAIGMSIGTILGMSAGFFGGFVEATVMRVFDSFLAFPGLILALAIADFLGPSEFHTILAISAFGVSSYGRLSRSQTLGIRHRDFVTAARSNGVKPLKNIFGHVLPNILPPLLAYAMITIGVAMLIEASLSYLGLGIKIPQPSWGNLIASGEPYLASDPALVIEPSVCLFVTVLCLNFLADSLRQRLRLNR